MLKVAPDRSPIIYIIESPFLSGFNIDLIRCRWEGSHSSFTPDREHGWYRKFEKKSKKRNLRG